MRAGLKTVGLLALCCLAAACNKQDTVGSKYVKTQTIKAPLGGTVAVTATDDPTLALVGIQIQIPPSALAQDTLITVAAGDPVSDHAVGPVAEFGPAGTAFSHPVTIALPYALGAGQTVEGLTVVGVDAAGKPIAVSHADLKIDTTAKTVRFTAAGLIRFGAAWTGPGASVCPAGTEFCGCCGNGSCIPAGQACPLLCPANACPFDGGSGGGGGSCCPAGEAFCGCGTTGTCLPAGVPCAIMCEPASAGAAPSPSPVCCPPDTYLCGCGGEGRCIPDNQACPLTCPVCDPPRTLPSPCGCLPPGAICQCDPNRPSTVPCQCDPNSAAAGGPVCEVDGGDPCPSPNVLTECGCLPPTAFCAPPPDGGRGCSNPTDRECCDGRCVASGQVCPTVCFSDGGSGSVDGGICPAGTNRCPSGQCVPAGQDCAP